MDARKFILVVLGCGFFFSLFFLITLAWMTEPALGAMVTLFATTMGAALVIAEWPRRRE